MPTASPRLLLVSLTLLLSSLTHRAQAVKIADVTRIGGQRTNIMTGLGLVYGLHGTGDGGAFAAAINPLREMLTKFADPVQVKDLSNAANVALVALTATIPANGVSDGDHLDVHLTSLGAAASLKGGRLFVTPMSGAVPGGQLLAMAEGPLEIEDPSTPTVAVVHAASGGAVMEVDLPAHSIDDSGRFYLIIDEPSASWTMASTIAQIINDSEGGGGETLAVVLDQKNVVVTIPANERDHPDGFISRVQRLPLKIVPTEARVQINSKTGTIVITGDVEISPVVISQRGLSISIVNPAPVPSPRNPIVENHDLIELSTDAPVNGNLQDLITALKQLEVPTEDRIDILKTLYNTGKLHAKLIIDPMSAAPLQPLATKAHGSAARLHSPKSADASPRHKELVRQTQKWVAQTFYGTMLKQMRKSPFHSELFDGGRGGQVFHEMLDQKIADHMSRNAAPKLVDSIVQKIERGKATASYLKHAAPVITPPVQPSLQLDGRPNGATVG